MQSHIESYSIDMQQYDFSFRTGSFLDIDTKTKDKYFKPGKPASYNQLVKLNVDLKKEMTILRRICSSKSEKTR